MEQPNQEQLIAELAVEAEAKRRRIADLERQLREEREGVAYINGQLAILRQITLQPAPIWREGGAQFSE